MAQMANAKNFVAKAQGNFEDMTRPGQGTMSDAKGAFADMTSTGGKGSMAEPGEGRRMEDDGVVADEGGWMYRDLGDGRIEIMAAPKGSRMVGQILDPKKIDAIADPAQRARAGRAYASIKSVMAGGKAIPQGARPQGARPKTPSAPATSAGGATDPGTPGLEGLPMTKVPSGSGLPSAVETILAGPARPRTRGGM